MIDFPNTPTPGQIFNPGTGLNYIWDGTSWNIVTTASPLAANPRNLVVNPCMQHGQENGSTAGTTQAYYAADQWFMQFTHDGVTSAQLVASVTPEGAAGRFRLTVTTADAAIAAGQYCEIVQKIEGVRCMGLLWGSASARQAVLRFGFKGPVGTYGVSILNGATDRAYIAMFTIAAGQANTDTVQVVVIPGDIIGTWATDTSIGLWIRIILAAGTTFQGVLGWQAGSPMATSAISNGIGVVNNVFELFDVGLYIDPNNTGLPPQFQVPDYAFALSECQRYWATQYVHIQVPVAGYGIVPWYTPVPMRITPALTVRSAGSVSAGSVNQDTASSPQGGLLQFVASGANGSVTSRLYGLNARM